MPSGKIKAVHDDDIIELLTSLDVYEKFSNGDAHCEICNAKINFENFQVLFPHNGKVAFCCSNPDCYMKVIQEEI